jgi:hypothetical protein
MIRDDELNRLIRYCQGMGLAVHFKPYVKNSNVSAEWAIDGSEITIYTSSRCSKIEKIVSLIHEASHHKAFINNQRKVDPKVEESLGIDGRRNKKRILNMEISDSQHWEEIYRDTNCQFDINRLYMERDFDIWTYQFDYDNDRIATTEEKTQKRKELRKKYYG